MRKAIVLLSGGQDSTTCLFWARSKFDEVEAVSVDYAQRHATELEAAREIAIRADAPWSLIKVPGFADMVSSATALTREGQSAIKAEGGYLDSEAPRGLPTSYVPGRNLLFLTLVGTLAVVRGVRDIVTGVCQTDYSGYPDCRRVFVDAMEQALTLAMPSTAGPLRIHTPLMFLTKAETVRMARTMPGAWDALALSITCYEGKRPGCGECPACRVRAKGFAEANAIDPATA